MKIIMRLIKIFLKGASISSCLLMHAAQPQSNGLPISDSKEGHELRLGDNLPSNQLAQLFKFSGFMAIYGSENLHRLIAWQKSEELKQKKEAEERSARIAQAQDILETAVANKINAELANLNRDVKNAGLDKWKYGFNWYKNPTPEANRAELIENTVELLKPSIKATVIECWPADLKPALAQQDEAEQGYEKAVDEFMSRGKKARKDRGPIGSAMRAYCQEAARLWEPTCSEKLQYWLCCCKR